MDSSIIIDNAERRRRLAVRHALTPRNRVASLSDAASALVGLHSSDPATVYLSAWARMVEPSIEAIANDLYADRSVVRVLGMRRTMFVVPTDLAPLLIDGCVAQMVPRERARLLRMLNEHGSEVDEEWLADVERRTLAAIGRLGPSVATEISAEVPELTTKIVIPGQGSFGLSTRVLFLLATTGAIVRAEPRGSWISSQYRWALTDEWLGGPRATMDLEEARLELVRRWLHSFGPGTLKDICWWTGWGKTEVRRLLGSVGATAVDVGSGEAYALGDDLEATPDPGPWVALLPSLDPTTMGWKEREWYLGDHQHALFDRNGNAGPTIWADGHIVGGWAQLTSGEVVYRFLEPVTGEIADAVRARAGELQGWLGKVVVTPRFRTPLDTELRA